ncbi:MAG: hypothetical protein KF865_03505 [Bdellovibrionaceae bacterium]|nr:hypothetical protein [Pseudobdellovibrionaceae bacterium]
MLKAIEKAKIVAENDTRRRRADPFLRELESQLTKNILAQSLALHVIRHSQKPTSKLIEELMNIEARVGDFLGKALEEIGGKTSSAVDMRGTLAGVLALIPMKRMRPRPSLKRSLRKAAEAALDRILPDPTRERMSNPQTQAAVDLTTPLETAPTVRSSKKKNTKANKVPGRQKIRTKSGAARP